MPSSFTAVTRAVPPSSTAVPGDVRASTTTMLPTRNSGWRGVAEELHAGLRCAGALRLFDGRLESHISHFAPPAFLKVHVWHSQLAVVDIHSIIMQNQLISMLRASSTRRIYPF